MSTQPEALRLAKELVSVHQGHADEGPSTFSEAAAELRRLHESVTYFQEAYGQELKTSNELRSVNADLLDELKRLRRAYVSLLETGRDRIIQYGGQCDSVEAMEAADPYLKSSSAVIAKATGAA